MPTTKHPKPEKAASLIPQDLLAVCPTAVTALLLLARRFGQALELPIPQVAQILNATKVSRSAAYEVTSSLVELLPTLVRPQGRPQKQAPEETSPSDSEAAQLTHAALEYVMRHPGCVHLDRVRQGYNDGFRHFVLEQRRAHASLDLEVFAAAFHLPLGTMKDWLRDPSAGPNEQVQESPSTAPPVAELEHIQTVLDAWRRWQGTFVDFCAHVRCDLHVPFGTTLVTHVLDAHGARSPARRKGRRSDEVASRGAFVTYFPGAQWVGDGMTLPVVVDGQRFTVNLELNVDAHTGAFVGISVRDTEDSLAVVEAFHDGISNTGAPSLSLLLDNRPSNHTVAVDAALGDTRRIRATLFRPQNKAHVEGAFGLFSRVLPELVLDTTSGARSMALSLVRLIAPIWATTMNHRPRSDRNGRSRFELYGNTPSAEQVDRARRELHLVAERQERAQRTLEARRRPEVLAILDASFLRLGLLDPERHIRVAIAGYPSNAVVAGLAIFEGKHLAATLPEGADARYLLGIVRNTAAKVEGEQVARAMLDLRLELRDRMLAPLCAARAVLCSGPDLARIEADVIDRALKTQSPLERMFWLNAMADVLASRPDAERRALFLDAARRIHATFAVSPRERGDAVRVLAERLVPAA